MTHEQALTGPIAALAAVRFLAELGLLAAMGWIGFHLVGPLALALVLMLLLPAATGTIWGMWVAPRAARRLRDPARLAVEVTLFGLAFVGMLGVGDGPWMWVIGVGLWATFLISTPVRRRGL